MSVASRTNRRILENLRFQDLIRLEKDRNLNHNKLTRLERQLLERQYPVKTSESERLNINKNCDLWLHNNNSQLNSTCDSSINSSRLINLSSQNNSERLNSSRSSLINNFVKRDKENVDSKNKLITHHRVDIPLSCYPLNVDNNPIIVNKKPNENVEYKQEIFYRYLKPPTPQQPGDIIIRQEPDVRPPAAPPLILRQIPKQNIQQNQEPIIIREMPPKNLINLYCNNNLIEKKIITVKSQQNPPPPRKIIIERYKTPPPKPPPIILERWLPCDNTKRKVIYEKSSTIQNVHNYNSNHNMNVSSNNTINTSCLNRSNDTIKTDPVDYLNKYGPCLMDKQKLPDYVSKIMPSTKDASTQVLKINDCVENRASFRRVVQQKKTLANSTITSSNCSTQTLPCQRQKNAIQARSKSANDISINRHYLNRHIHEFEQIVINAFSNKSTKFDKTIHSIIERMFISLRNSMKQNEFLTIEETLRVLFEIKRLLGSKTTDEYLNLIFFKIKQFMNPKIDVENFKRAFRKYLD